MEKEVQIPDGRWYTMRILPYRTLDNRIDGAVVTFADVSRLKRLEDSLQGAKAYAESIVETVREPLLVLDSALRVVSANPSFYRAFRAAPKATVGQFVYDLGDGQWDIPDLRKLLEEVVPARSEFKDFQVEQRLPGARTSHHAPQRPPNRAGGRQPALILLAIEDVTEREQARRQIEVACGGVGETRPGAHRRTGPDGRRPGSRGSRAAEGGRVAPESRQLAENRLAELERIYDTAPAGLALLDTEHALCPGQRASGGHERKAGLGAYRPHLPGNRA